MTTTTPPNTELHSTEQLAPGTPADKENGVILGSG
jgi:hypothetical protein